MTHFYFKGKICENLFCKIGTATNCKSKGIPYADGTPCGANKVRL